jgi:GTP-binding protein HflX
VRGWTHLERQKGGIGLRGPGETQLETDRRLVARRIRHLRERLSGSSGSGGQPGERLRADVPRWRWLAIPMPVRRRLQCLGGANLIAKDQLSRSST